jgi:hypothetical protein
VLTGLDVATVCGEIRNRRYLGMAGPGGEQVVERILGPAAPALRRSRMRPYGDIGGQLFISAKTAEHR